MYLYFYLLGCLSYAIGYFMQENKFGFWLEVFFIGLFVLAIIGKRIK